MVIHSHNTHRIGMRYSGIIANQSLQTTPHHYSCMYSEKQ